MIKAGDRVRLLRRLKGYESNIQPGTLGVVVWADVTGPGVEIRFDGYRLTCLCSNDAVCHATALDEIVKALE